MHLAENPRHKDIAASFNYSPWRGALFGCTMIKIFEKMQDYPVNNVAFKRLKTSIFINAKKRNTCP